MFIPNLLQAYARQREGGEADMGSVLLAVISELQGFNFHDTFTDPFEVGLLHACYSRSCRCGSWGLGLPMLSAIARAANSGVPAGGK